MPINISESKEAFLDKLNAISLMRKCAQNPVYTALIISILVFLIMIFTMRHISPELATTINDDSLSENRWFSPKTKSIFTGAVYSFGAIAGLMLLHNYLIMSEVKEGAGDERSRAAMTDTMIDDKSPDFVPVNINVDLL